MSLLLNDLLDVYLIEGHDTHPVDRARPSPSAFYVAGGAALARSRSDCMPSIAWL
jgi:hypothetical protein